jgi:hypothetical protein
MRVAPATVAAWENQQRFNSNPPLSNRDADIAAATQAYRLARCGGPPFAYYWGLVAAWKHLRELGVPEPEMPRFDESKFEPMPEVEIDPEDEFHAGTVTDDGGPQI